MSDGGRVTTREFAGPDQSSPDVPPPLEEGGTVVGRYRIERLLGVGARKRVHLARDVWLDRDVAVCTLRPDVLTPAEVARLRCEAMLLARLGDHPCIVAVHDLGEHDGAPVVICQYLPGGSLEERLTTGPVPVEEVLSVARDVASALEHAHALRIVHRDIKPANVWLTRNGAAVLGDFGLAVTANDTVPPADTVSPAGVPLVGTAAYMAPEQVVGEPPGTCSDLYSLGALLYELLCGRPPFIGTTVIGVVTQVLNDAVPPPSRHRMEVPPALDELVVRLLAKQAADRPASASDVVAALTAMIDDVGPGAGPPPAPAPEPARGGFVGRQDELAQLRSALDQAAAGRGGLTLLVGEAGMGKTRTALELASEAAEQGWSVLPGRCHDGDGAPVFWPWTQVLRAAAREHGADRLRELAGHQAPLLASLLPDLGPSVDLAAGPLDAAQGRFQLFDAVATLLTELAVERPVLVVIDDVHWADAASLALAVFVARQLANTRVAVLACSREPAVDADPSTAAGLGRLAEAADRTVPLGGLPAEQAALYLERVLGVHPGAELLRGLHELTGGNPFFLAELVRLLAAEQRLGSGGVLLPSDTVIPDGVREVLHRRLGHVSAACAALLRIAAVLGREPRLDVLCRVAETEVEQVLPLLDEACRARLMVALAGVPTRYRFAHALVQESLHDELPAVDRVRLHRLAGQALVAVHAGDDDTHAAELAHHFVRGATGGDVSAALHWSVRAAHAAAASGAYEDAVLHYARAVAIAEPAAASAPADAADAPAYGELLLALGEAQCRAGDTDAGRASCQRAASEGLLRGDGDLLARAALGYGVGLGGFGFVEHADGVLLSLLEEALAAQPEQDSGLRVRLMSRLATELYFTPFRRRRLMLSEQAVEMAARLGDPAIELVALYSRTLALLGPDGVAERRRTAERVVRLAASLEDWDMTFRGHCLRLGVALETGTREQVEADVASCRRLADEHRHPVHRWQAAVFEAMLELLGGRFELGRRRADEALQLGRRGHSDMAMVMYGAQVLAASWGQGRLDEIVEAVRSFADRYPYAPAWRAALAFCYLELERLDAAAAELDVLAQRDFADLPCDGNYLTALALLAHVAAGVDDRRRAALLEQALAPYADRTVVIAGGAVALTSVELALGVLRAALGDHEGALAHLARAQEQHERRGARAHVVWTAQEQLRVLLARDGEGDREAAGALLSTMLPLARELGMARHVERLLAVAAGTSTAGASPGDSLHALGAEVEHGSPERTGAMGTGAPLTVLLTDIAGSTVLTERLGERAVHVLLVEHRRRVEACAQEHGGVVLKSLGDGLLLAFSDAAEALRCAVQIQRLHRDGGGPVLRIGVHTGQVLREGDSIYGRTMILAFRIADRSRAGEVLVSTQTRTAAADAVDLHFDAGRRLRLKGFDEPERLHRLVWADEPAAEAPASSPGQRRAKRSSA